MDATVMLHRLSGFFLLAQSNAQAQVGAGQATGSADQWPAYLQAIGFVVGIFILPFVLSHLICRAIRMPSHSTRMGVMFAALIAAFLFAWKNDFKLRLGPDMKGGTNIVYDIIPSEDGELPDPGALASALSDRLNPSGTQEITIRPRGSSQIEIIVPNTDPLELRRIKEMLQTSGQLEFRIVANTRDHQDIIALAREQSQRSLDRDVRNSAGRTVGRWYLVAREDKMVQGVFPFRTPVYGDIIRDAFTGRIIDNPPLDFNEDYALEKWLKKEGIREIEVLMALEAGGVPFPEVTGDDLASATMEFDKSGYVVAFRLTPTGAQKMLRLTAANQPTGSFHRRMAIIMDGKVLSAPQLNSPISTSGIITGNFTKEEVEFLVTILRAGRLPATLSDEPASEIRVGAGLGAATVEKGLTASVWAVILTFATILVYYRFSGVIASLALLMNGLLIFGIMVFIGQPLTLPGLAGLVLTVGMSVDANVLIFERIREERAKGAAPRMAIRNGFDRAFTTIVDANLTTLIAAVVLYWIGTDQVRGFAVALIIGIMTSMFTATFCSRILFEISEKLRWVSLSMADGVGFLKRVLFGDRDIDFMRWRTVCYSLSVAMIVVGISAAYLRGRDLLNIDFTGGTSVTFQLTEPIAPDELREVLKRILAADDEGKPVQFTLVRVEKEPADTVYSLVTSIDNEEHLAKKLVDGFAADSTVNLKTYRVKVLSVTPISWLTNPAGLWGRLVGFQADSSPNASASAEPQAEVSELNATPAAQESVPTEESSAGPVAPEQATGSEEALDDGAGGENGPVVHRTEFVIEFGGSTDDNPAVPEEDKGARVDAETLINGLVAAAKQLQIEISEQLIEVEPDPKPENWRPEDIGGYQKWRVVLPLEESEARELMTKFEANMEQEPIWLSLSTIGSRVAEEMQQRAIAAILLSLVFIVAYIWFRFQRVSYGLAAVVALVHDVLITLGVLAMCHWLAQPLEFLLIEDFKIGLTEVAAFLTIIGYSLNDTIVVFDRVREVRGRSPRLTSDMINTSINQTLARTLLTSGTTLLTIVILYVFGGEGIHAFSFALLVGVLVGTYSSIFIASPVLLFLSKRAEQTAEARRAAVATTNR
ncbi:MAG: protein-export membrane protein SecD [Pirellulaceae bacterium]|nr:MAG: protein-export membrane protein SecD [Pirellulaceae bacterium]